MFHCTKCGRCCSNIRGVLDSEQKKEFEQLAFGRLPIVQVLPLGDMSFPIWNWEYEAIKKYIEENGINPDIIKPARVVFDLASNKSLIVAHCIDSDECVFLDKKNKNACKIYKIRPMICRQYPFQNGPFYGDRPYLGSCPASDGMNLSDEIMMDRKKMFEIFGDSYVTAGQKDLYMKWVNETILKLMRDEKLRPAMKYPYKFLKKRHENAEKVMFMDYLVEIGFMTRKEMDQKIDNIRNNRESEEKLKIDGLD